MPGAARRPTPVPAVVAARVAAALGIDEVEVLALDVIALGRRYESVLAQDGARRRSGAWYTPLDVVDHVLDLALDAVLAEREQSGAEAVAALRVVDPSCGAGAFLVGAADRIAAALVRSGVGIARARAVAAGRCVSGIDIDPVAADLSRIALVRAGACWADAERRVRVADALLDDGWEQVADGALDVVVGNPPFRSRLHRRAAPETAYVREVAARLGGAAGAYTDVAALFLLAAVQRVRPDGGRVALLQPESVLVTRDAARVRARIAGLAEVCEVWAVPPSSFDAAVRACVPVLRCRPPAVDGPDGWSAAVPRVRSLPVRRPRTAGVLGDVATATADFRDQYYGLAPALVDDPDLPDATHPQLVTTGLVDPAACTWGAQPARVLKRRLQHPRVELALLDERMRRWAAARLVPKVIVATQTRVLECVVDDAGTLLPSVPLISVVPTTVSAWHVAAVLSSPPATLVAAERHLGAGLSSDALKLAAREVLALPLPRASPEWDRAAAAIRCAHAAGDDLTRSCRLREAAVAMLDAYGLGDDPELLAWWEVRRAKVRVGRSGGAAAVADLPSA